MILNLPLVGLWVQLLKVPYSILFPVVLAFTVVGAYVTANSVFDIYVLIAFGLIGYLFKKIDMPIAPMAFTLILGPLTENALRQSLSMSGGDLSVLLRGPVSASLMALAILVLAFPLIALAWRSIGFRRAGLPGRTDT